MNPGSESSENPVGNIIRRHEGHRAAKFELVDDYINTFLLDLQTALQAVRKTITAAAPGAV